MVSARRWDCYARFYDILLRPAAQQRRQVFDHLALKSARRIYLAGCGSGLDLAYLPQQSAVSAVDFSAVMLRKCAERAQHLSRRGHSLDLTLRQGAAEHSSLPDCCVDVVILHLILAVIDNPQALLQEACRIVKPDGIISVWDKFVPPQQKVGRVRRMADYLARKVGTTLVLDIDALLQPHSLAIMQRHSMFQGRMRHGQMQHLVLQKERTESR
ncbi:class I SAM-dependent methyltransferase [Chelonobacter oris]|uniref:class I SAM-dependent methyltransferase n=1 Tax=Chelonobacter oris TaxID=505317 RepID=UPI00068A56A7|nr:class I SAM-dependent methyltransferase [Chelonobacter oris]